MSYPLFETFDLWLLSIRQKLWQQVQRVTGHTWGITGITTILLFVCVCACALVSAQKHVYAHMHTGLHTDVSVLAFHCECDGNHSVSTASQHLEILGHKKEHNAPKLDKAQCSFCCYSETRPSLSPTHICKIINRCLKSLLRPAYRKYTLSTSLYYSIFSVTMSGSVPLHFLNSISTAHVLTH